MKKRLIKVGVLAAVFIAALVISSMVINSGTDDEIVDMGSPTLPRVSFTVGNTEVNPLFGYVQDMDITAMRDTITPLGAGGSLTMNIEENGNKISDIAYEVYSLDGEDKYTEGKAEGPDEDGQASLQIGNILSDEVREAVLKVILTTGDETVSYYTRIADPTDLTTQKCLEYAMDFHDKAINQEGTEDLQSHLEPNEESDRRLIFIPMLHMCSGENSRRRSSGMWSGALKRAIQYTHLFWPNIRSPVRTKTERRHCIM